jgi:hypothetical protein
LPRGAQAHIPGFTVVLRLTIKTYTSPCVLPAAIHCAVGRMSTDGESKMTSACGMAGEIFRAAAGVALTRFLGMADCGKSVAMYFRPARQPVGFVPNVGSQLAFASQLPELGACSQCGRSYHQGDFANLFCPSCGTPISIEPAVRTEYQRQNEIETLLAAVPSLQKAGYLPTALSRKG